MLRLRAAAGTGLKAQSHLDILDLVAQEIPRKHTASYNTHNKLCEATAMFRQRLTARKWDRAIALY